MSGQVDKDLMVQDFGEVHGGFVLLEIQRAIVMLEAVGHTPKSVYLGRREIRAIGKVFESEPDQEPISKQSSVLGYSLFKVDADSHLVVI